MKHFDTLGVMLDCSRNAVMRSEEVRQFILTIAKMGYNRVMLYTEDTYEVDGEPYFGYLRGRYTKEELKSLDCFCIENGVSLVPCIQTLAHLGAILRWEPYAEIKDCNDILMIGEDRTYQLIEHMFATLRECFSSSDIHIGMDEAHFVGLGKYMKKHGITNRLDMMQAHLERVCKIAEKYQFNPMMWNDMFFHLADGTEETYENIRRRMPKNLSLVYWDYYRSNKEEYIEKIKQNHHISQNVKFAGGAWCWHGFAPCNLFSIRAMKSAFSACIEEGIRDALITMWGDDGHECGRYSVLPTLAWAACLAENENADETYVRARFFEWTGESYDDFLLLDMPNHVGKGAINVENPCKYLLYNDPFNGIYDRTVDIDDSCKYREISEKLLLAGKRSHRFGYLFETLQKLCELLAVKCDLGVRTREMYRKDDKQGLLSLVGDYNKCLVLLDLFSEAFYTQWIRENKPHGFDVQDLRIGGLQRRLFHCAQRLKAYAEGKTDRIEELEQEILPISSAKKDGDAVSMNIWIHNATANVVCPFYSPLC